MPCRSDICRIFPDWFACPGGAIKQSDTARSTVRSGEYRLGREMSAMSLEAAQASPADASGAAAARPAGPHILLTLAEAQRAMLEAGSMLTLGPLMRALPKGDGHAVMVLPGFMATDQSTALFRRHLTRLGYRSRPWAFGRNRGPRDDLMAQMVSAVARLADETGGPVSLVGQSLGGIYAREISRVIPEQVRQVISLGSPFGSADGGGTNPGVARLFELSTGKSAAAARAEQGFTDMAEPPPVPSTAIFSKTDGIASWRICLEREAATTDNVEIIGSHCGMAFNPAVLWVVADRLAQAANHWRRFARTGSRRYLFPGPVFAS